jgi:hypothetical protein
MATPICSPVKPAALSSSMACSALARSGKRPRHGAAPGQIPRIDVLRHRVSLLVTRRLSDTPPPRPPTTEPTEFDIVKVYSEQRDETPDPTSLLLNDETDRLKTASLEQVRDIFDHGELGVVLIGMPGLEKRLSRDPQLSSRVGFVHAFRPLRAQEVRGLL